MDAVEDFLAHGRHNLSPSESDCHVQLGGRHRAKCS